MQINIKEEPHSLKAEQMVLGSILVNNKNMELASESVKVEMFYEEQHKEIYSAMVYLHYNNVGISYDTIIGRLTEKGQKYDIDYILALANSVPSFANFEGYVKTIVDTYDKRMIYEFSKNTLTKDIDGIASSDIMKEIQSLTDKMNIASNIETSEFNEYIDEWVEWLDSDEKPQKYKFGLKELDDTVLLEDSNLIVLASRPSVGKSAIALTFVKNFLKQGYRTLFVSLEMSRKEIMNRLVANIAHIPAQKLKRKEPLTQDERKRVMKAKEDIRKYNMNVYDKSGMRIEQLMGLAKKLKKENKLDILVIDYLQLLEVGKKTQGRTQEVEYVSRKLKQIASELNIPVIALSQLSRASVENGVAREPQLTDLRQSGSIEQDANAVLMLHSPDVDNKYQDVKFLDLFVRKNRDGRLGHIKYTYYGDYIQFIEKQFNKKEKRYMAVEQEPMFYEYNENEKNLNKPKIVEKKETPKKEEKQLLEDLPF